MTKTKVLSVVAHSTERVDGPRGYGLVAAIERSISSFLEGNGGEEVSYTLAGATIDQAAGHIDAPDAVFGRTLVVLTFEPGSKPKKKGK